MLHEIVFLIKPFCTLGAVVLPKAGQVLFGFIAFVLLEMAGDVQVGVHLVEVAAPPTCLLFGVGASDCRHCVLSGWGL